MERLRTETLQQAEIGARVVASIETIRRASRELGTDPTEAPSGAGESA